SPSPAVRSTNQTDVFVEKNAVFPMLVYGPAVKGQLRGQPQCLDFEYYIVINGFRGIFASPRLHQKIYNNINMLYVFIHPLLRLHTVVDLSGKEERRKGSWARCWTQVALCGGGESVPSHARGGACA